MTVDVTGPQNQSTVTDTKGEAHFLNLPPGSYQVKASLSGFADFLNRAVAVTAAGAVPLRVMMGVQGVAEQVRTRISSSNTPSDLVETLGGISGNGSRLTKYADYGVELGEPLVKDKWWG